MVDEVDIGTFYTGDDGRLKQQTGRKVAMEADSVLVRITHCGLCASELTVMRMENAALGHEPIGLVERVGEAVNGFKVGDRVGWGCVRGACGSCGSCRGGHDQNCKESKSYGKNDDDTGGFSDFAVVKAGWLHHIPKGMPSEDAAVLQCGGATVVGALINCDVHPFDRVAVVGIGGLGHLAIMFADKMGCEVVAISGTESKKAEALSLGAREFHAVKTNPSLKGIKPVKHVIVCTSAQADWKALLKIVEPRGSIATVSVDGGNFNAPYWPFIAKEVRLIGSMVANRKVHQQMLEFAQRHKIKPMIEQLPMDEKNLNVAVDRLRKGDVRYRFVLVHEKHAKAEPARSQL